MAGFLDRLLPFRQARKPAPDSTQEKRYGGSLIPPDWEWNWWQQGKDPIRRDPTAIVHACVDAYAQTIASIPPYHWRYDDRGTKVKVTASAASRTLLNPNSYQTRSDLYLNLVKGLMLNGKAFVLGTRNERNEIVEFHQLPSLGTQPYIEPGTKSVFYAVGDNPLIETYQDINYLVPARDVCHIRLYCPRHPLEGVSPIENAAAAIYANSAITSNQAAFFDNMNRPSGVLSTEMTLNEQQMEQLRAAFAEQSKKMAAGGVPILGGGIKWQPMSISSQDAQLIDAFNMTIEDVARAFRVPLPLVGDNRNSTYNNVEQLIGHWLSGGLGFVLEHIENAFDKFYGLHYAKERIEFDVDMLMRTDFQGRIEGLTKAIQFGLLSPNEGRAKFGGLPAVEHGDKPLVQQQMVPLGWEPPAAQPAPPPAEPEPAPDPEPASLESAGLIDLDDFRHRRKKLAATHG